jgi:hypothetical protein
MGNFYSITYSSLTSTSGEKDLVHILGSTTSRYRLHYASVFQSTSAYSGSSDDELNSVRILRGLSGAAAGGSTGAAVRIRSSGQVAAEMGIDINSSTPAAGGTNIHSGQHRTGDPFVWRPAPEERPEFGLGERLSLRLGPVSKVVTMGVNVIVEEYGKIPGE